MITVGAFSAEALLHGGQVFTALLLSTSFSELLRPKWQKL